MPKHSVIIKKFPMLGNLDLNFVKNIKMFGYFGTIALFVMLDDNVFAVELNKFGTKTREPKLINELCDKSIIKFDCGCDQFILALSMNSTVYSWGRNSCGQLGVGDISDRIIPEMINGLSDVIDVCCGGYHSLVLTVKGEVYAFGSNSCGQIGNGCYDNQLIPTKLNSFGDEIVIAISCGLEHSLALTGTGRVFGWGSNRFRQISAQQKDCLKKPNLISNYLPFINKIKCGQYNSLLLSSNCELYILGSTDVSTINTKILKDDDKFVDIGASIHCQNFIGINLKSEYVVWNESLLNIYVCKTFQDISVNEAFSAFSDITVTLNNVWLMDDSLMKRRYDQFLEKHSLIKYKNKFNEIKIFSRGAFGIIAKVVSRSDCKIYAMKKLLRDEYDIRSNKNICIDSELEIIKKLDCDNIVTYFDIFTEYIDSLRSLIFIQMEFCSITLFDVIKEMKIFNNDINHKLFSYVMSSKLFSEILDGVNYLHKHNPPIIHRNLSWNNILITNNYRGKLIKICSFSYATFHEFEDQSHTSFVVNDRFQAPEVAISRKYDTKSDIYSLGLIMQNLFNIEININSNSVKFLKSIHSYSSVYLNARRKLIKLLSPQAKNRPNCEELLSDDSWRLSYDQIKHDYSYDELIKNFHEKSFFRYFIETNLKQTKANASQIVYNNIISLANSSYSDTCEPKIDIQYIPISGDNSVVFTTFRKDSYEQCFTELNQLGSGGFGTVFKSENIRDNKVYAVKKIPLSDNNEELTDASKELSFLSQLKSEYIVECVDYWIEDNYYMNAEKLNNYLSDRNMSGNTRLFNPHKPKLLHIQMELCSHSLKTVIENLKKQFIDQKTQKLTAIGYYISCELFIEILECVHYIHKQIPPIIHRDLKPDNILLTHSSNGRFVKLADFGIATVHNFDCKSHTEYAGTFKYMAPEVANGRQYDTKADIYSLGMIAQQLFVVDINKSINKNIDSFLNEKFDFLFELITKLLSPKTSDRLNCYEMLNKKNMWSLSVEQLKIICNATKINASLDEVNTTIDNFCYIFLKSRLKL